MTTTVTLVVQTPVTVNNSPVLDYTQGRSYSIFLYEMTPGFKPFTEFLKEIFYHTTKKKEIIEFLSHCCLLVFSKIKITKVTMFLKKGWGGGGLGVTMHSSKKSNSKSTFWSDVAVL